MSTVIVPIAESHAESFRACLDAVAREKRYIAQVEALPLERIQDFVRESVATGAAQFVAVDGSVVVGWCDIFPAWAHAIQHCGSVGMGLLPSYRGQGLGRQLLSTCLARQDRTASRAWSLKYARTTSTQSSCMNVWVSRERH